MGMYGEYGYVWVCMGMYGYVWVCMVNVGMYGEYGYVCVWCVELW